MTQEEIKKQGKFTNYPKENFSEFELVTNIPFFKKDVSIKVFGLSSVEDDSEMNVLTKRLNQILDFPENNKQWLSEEIWKHYNICVENGSYGMVSYESFESEVEANKAYFSISNKQEALDNATIYQIHFDLSFKNENYFNLEFNCPWEDEHGIIITVKNGKFDSIT